MPGGCHQPCNENSPVLIPGEEAVELLGSEALELLGFPAAAANGNAGGNPRGASVMWSNYSST